MRSWLQVRLFCWTKRDFLLFDYQNGLYIFFYFFLCSKGELTPLLSEYNSYFVLSLFS